MEARCLTFGARAPIFSGLELWPMTINNDIERVLYSESQIISGIDRVAREVTRTYDGRDFTVVCVLKGSCVFASDLIRRIPIPLELA